ncbi:MAG: efflux RND transporter periplasmic adaptor subunit [Propionibacteriaceae bacterium]|jgi:HlyD family secretion protein|nr:efflux RND transporter periplasmic adaptor subunit [Propionibacteriaceae bacterium]
MAASKPKAKIAIAAVVAALVGGGIWWWWTSTQTPAETGLSVSGSVEATEYQVSALIAAQIIEIKVEEGQQVKAADELVILDSQALQLMLDQANAGVTAANAALDQAKDDGTKADEKAAKAKIEQAKAQVKLAKVQLGYASVKAPASGIVTSVITNVGQAASPARTLLTILDPTDIFARGYVPEDRLGEVKLGQKAVITSDSGDEQFTGTLEYIASDAEFTPNTVQTEDQRTKLVYQIRVRLTDQSGILKAGMPINIKLGE